MHISLKVMHNSIDYLDAGTSSSCMTSSTGPFISAVVSFGKLQKIMGKLGYFKMEENAGETQLGLGAF